MLQFLGYLTRRIVWAFPTIAGLILLIFVFSRMIPAEPAAMMAGPFATPEMVEKIKEREGFNKPPHIQLLIYYKNIMKGNLGQSLYTHRDISSDILMRFPATLELTLVSLGWAVLLGIPVGTISALKRNTWVDHFIRGVTIVGVAIASFWLAIMLQIILGWKLDLVPVHGRLTVSPPEHIIGFYLVDSLLAMNLETFLDACKHLLLPALSLGFPCFATLVRFSRAGMLDELGKEYVLYLRAMGLPHRLFVYKYVLRSAIPVPITQIGLLFGAILGGNVVIEMVFDWPGIGSYVVESILNFDYNAILGVGLWAVSVFIAANLLVDVALKIFDPREISK